MASSTNDPLFSAIYPDYVFTLLDFRNDHDHASRRVVPNCEDSLFCAAQEKIYTMAGNVKASETVCCMICYDTCPRESAWQPSDSSCIKATEGICESCLFQYVTAKINVLAVNANRTIACPCPTVGCSAVICEEDISNILRFHEPIKNKFLSFCENVEVATNPLKRWCPSRDCKTVITCKSNQTRAACPTCNRSCCFKCNASHPMWVTCGMVNILDMIQMVNRF
jgi:hypothetical protein